MTTATTITRRSLLAAAPVAAVAVAIPAAAYASEDAAILAAWDRRKAAYHAINSNPDLEPGEPEEERYWAIVDEVEETIRAATAKTPLGVEVQLWMALYHSASMNADGDAIVLRGDLEALATIERGLDWNAKIILAAIRSVRSMAA